MSGDSARGHLFFEWAGSVGMNAAISARPLGSTLATGGFAAQASLDDLVVACGHTPCPQMAHHALA